MESVIKAYRDSKVRSILLGSLIITLARGATLPYLPIYLHTRLDTTIYQTGVILTLAMTLGMFISAFSGEILKKWNNRTVIVISLALFSLGFIAIPYFSSATAFIISFVIINLSYGIFSTFVKSTIAAGVFSNTRVRVFSLNYTAINIGWVAGPVIGVFAAGLSAYASFVISSLCGLIVMCMLRDFPDNKERPTEIEKPPCRDPHLKSVILFIIAGFLIMFVYGRFASCISQVLMSQYSDETVRNIISVIVSVNAATIICLQYYTSSKIETARASYAFLMAFVFITGGIAIFSVAGINLALWAGAMVIFTLGEAIFSPLQFMVVDSISSSENKSRYFALQNISDTGGALNPLVTGAVISAFSPFVLYGLLVLICGASCTLFIIGLKISAQPEKIPS